MSRRLYFNLDLTLTKMEKSFDECLVYTLKELGVPEGDIDPEAYSSMFFSYFEDLEESPREKAFAEYSDKKGLNLDSTEAARIYYRKELEAAKPKPGLREKLEILSKSFSLGIVTAGTTELQKKKIERLEIAELLEEVLITYEEVRSKQEILREAGEKAGKTPIYFSNSESDKEKAEKAGLETAYMEFEDLGEKPAENVEEAVNQ